MKRLLSRALLFSALLLPGSVFAQQQQIAYLSDVVTPVTTMTASGTSTLAFTSAAAVAYEVTLTGNTTFSFTPGATGGYRKLTLIIHPAGFQATLPASSSSLVWAGGSAPTVNTTNPTIITFVSTGNAPIYGGL